MTPPCNDNKGPFNDDWHHDIERKVDAVHADWFGMHGMSGFRSRFLRIEHWVDDRRLVEKILLATIAWFCYAGGRHIADLVEVFKAYFTK